MNISNIKSDIDFLCGSTSATYSDTNKVRNINIAYHDVARLIWESDGTWHFDDTNNTNAPVAYRTIANASASYLVPTTAMRILGVEVKDASGDWYKLDPLDPAELPVSMEEYLTGVGMPIKYSLIGNEIRVFPAPGTGYTTMSSGMAVRLDRNVTEFATTASTAEPGFATPFHRILSLAASMDFTQDDRQRAYLAGLKARLEEGLARFYSNRGEEFTPQIKPASKRSWRNYL